MKRPTINFTDSMYEKLEKRIQEKELPSISECVRELVDLGFRIEEAAAKSNDEENSIDLASELSALKQLLKENTIWSLEARLLTRFLVEAHKTDGQGHVADILEQYKMKAQKHVHELLNGID
jgi:Arc/MetJ-type ribon-helix-helix transcriptional regulator